MSDADLIAWGCVAVLVIVYVKDAWHRRRRKDREGLGIGGRGVRR